MSKLILDNSNFLISRNKLDSLHLHSRILTFASAILQCCLLVKNNSDETKMQYTIKSQGRIQLSISGGAVMFLVVGNSLQVFDLRVGGFRNQGDTTGIHEQIYKKSSVGALSPLINVVKNFINNIFIRVGICNVIQMY